jgi:hypothetical protein
MNYDVQLHIRESISLQNARPDGFQVLASRAPE